METAKNYAREIVIIVPIDTRVVHHFLDKVFIRVGQGSGLGLLVYTSYSGRVRCLRPFCKNPILEKCTRGPHHILSSLNAYRNPTSTWYLVYDLFLHVFLAQGVPVILPSIKRRCGERGCHWSEHAPHYTRDSKKKWHTPCTAIEHRTKLQGYIELNPVNIDA